MTEVTDTQFAEFKLDQKIREALARMGYDTPTEIQARTLKLVLEGKDLMGQARTGTGKTAAFGIPMIQKISTELKKPQVLVLTPTRELCLQVEAELENIGREKGVVCVSLYGGASINKQIQALDDGSQVVVGTPGRVMDHLRRGTMKLDALKFVVLDEADRMLDMGFIDDIRWVLARSPSKRQTLLYSATLPDQIQSLAHEFMDNPVRIVVDADELSVPSIEQALVVVGRRNKLWALTRILEEDQIGKTMVFCATKNMVNMLDQQLKRVQVKADALHGDIIQSKREKIMERFRAGDFDVLIATDVAARGLDIDNVSMIVNWDIPDDEETYIHRIGRTGRMGRKGKAVSFVGHQEMHMIDRINEAFDIKIKEMEVPGGRARKGEKVSWKPDFDQIADPFGMVSFEIQVGRRDDLHLHDLVKLLTRGGLVELAVGKVIIKESTSRIQVHQLEAKKSWRILSSGNWNGRKLKPKSLDPVYDRNLIKSDLAILE